MSLATVSGEETAAIHKVMIQQATFSRAEDTISSGSTTATTASTTTSSASNVEHSSQPQPRIRTVTNSSSIATKASPQRVKDGAEANEQQSLVPRNQFEKKSASTTTTKRRARCEVVGRNGGAAESTFSSTSRCGTALDKSDETESVSSLSGEEKRRERKSEKLGARSACETCSTGKSNTDVTNQKPYSEKRRPFKKRKQAPPIMKLLDDRSIANSAFKPNCSQQASIATDNLKFPPLVEEVVATRSDIDGLSVTAVEPVRNQSLAEDEARRAAKREYNRRNAARARQREKDKIHELQCDIARLNPQVTFLRNVNAKLQAQKQVLEDQNRQLAQQQQQQRLYVQQEADPQVMLSQENHPTPFATNPHPQQSQQQQQQQQQPAVALPAIQLAQADNNNLSEQDTVLSALLLSLQQQHPPQDPSLQQPLVSMASSPPPPDAAPQPLQLLLAVLGFEQQQQQQQKPDPQYSSTNEQ